MAFSMVYNTSCVLLNPVTRTTVTAVLLLIITHCYPDRAALVHLITRVTLISLSLHQCLYFYICLQLPSLICPLFPVSIVLCLLISAAFQLETNEYASSPKHNLIPFVRHHIPSSVLLSHCCQWFYFDRKPYEETVLFFRSLSSPNHAVFVFNYCPR